MRRPIVATSLVALVVAIIGGAVRHGMTSTVFANDRGGSGNVLPALPGTAKIRVEARGTDGAHPVGSDLHIETRQQDQPLPRMPGDRERPMLPMVSGADGDWIIYNVGRGSWRVTVSASDFAWTPEANSQDVEVSDAEEISLSFALQRGGTVTGRVMAADTDEPIPGAMVTGSNGDRSQALTDSGGHFALEHVAPGSAVSVIAESGNYVPASSESIALADEQTATVADIRLQPGGWIVGRVMRPANAPEWAMSAGSLIVQPEAAIPSECRIKEPRIEADGSFRAGPVPAGAYTVKAYLSVGEGGADASAQTWFGEQKNVSVEVGGDTGGVLIQVSSNS